MLWAGRAGYPARVEVGPVMGFLGEGEPVRLVATEVRPGVRRMVAPNRGR